MHSDQKIQWNLRFVGSLYQPMSPWQSRISSQNSHGRATMTLSMHAATDTWRLCNGYMRKMWYLPMHSLLIAHCSLFIVRCSLFIVEQGAFSDVAWRHILLPSEWCLSRNHGRDFRLRVARYSCFLPHTDITPCIRVCIPTRTHGYCTMGRRGRAGTRRGATDLNGELVLLEFIVNFVLNEMNTTSIAIKSGLCGPKKEKDAHYMCRHTGEET